LCKSCRTCFMFYCMFHFTCDRSFSSVAAGAGLCGIVTLAGLSSQLLARLQLLQNAAARLIFSASRHVHITPLLRSLHCTAGFNWWGAWGPAPGQGVAPSPQKNPGILFSGKHNVKCGYILGKCQVKWGNFVNF